jgi:Anti-sigma-K factor rskA, C-terminal
VLAAITAAAITALAVVATVVIAGSGSTRGTAPRIIRLVLSPTAPQPTAEGFGSIANSGGTPQLTLTARGLAPSHDDSYAVWLFNSRADAMLLGFVPGGVGTDGRFTSSAPLPSDANRFHSLVVTREERLQPTTPGQIVLAGRLPLS